MAENSFRRVRCRLCDGNRLTPVLSLTPTPPANAFVPASAVGVPQALFPLDLDFCETCAHVQLGEVVDPRLLFEHYVYVSGTSPLFVAHFERYCRWVMERYTPAAGGLVVDIGSNDGTLLGFFQQAGMRVLGIDPAIAISQEATRRGIETLTGFFSPGLAREIGLGRGKAEVITANNVFAHIDDLAAIVAGIRDLLTPEGVFVFEVSYLLDVYQGTLFDTIYAEHLSYHTVKPLRRFFAALGLTLIHCERVDSHGGSLRGVARLATGSRPIDASVEALVALEEASGLDRAATFIDFGARIDAIRQELTGLLKGIKAAGKRIAAFGAPAKATTLMFHFGLGPDIIDFIVDDSPLKQGLFSPGLHVPVLPSQTLYEQRPDYVLILAWNFAGPIMKNHEAFRAGGGRFIVPLPKVTLDP
ncbi:MAG: class I SAM-dependent methyltransferase [Magnetococcales bacterium]|nr:class I SAM-dependent methyltransferase [Magnetococcales bacterium]